MAINRGRHGISALLNGLATVHGVAVSFQSPGYYEVVGGVLFAIGSQGTNGEVIRGALVLKGVMPGIESNDPV
jgi:hypothetical protein